MEQFVLDNNTQIGITFSARDSKEPSVLKYPYSFEFSLPVTPANEAALGNPHTSLPKLRIPATVRGVSGYVVIQGMSETHYKLSFHGKLGLSLRKLRYKGSGRHPKELTLADIFGAEGNIDVSYGNLSTVASGHLTSHIHPILNGLYGKGSQSDKLSVLDGTTGSVAAGNPGVDLDLTGQLGGPDGKFKVPLFMDSISGHYLPWQFGEVRNTDINCCVKYTDILDACSSLGVTVDYSRAGIGDLYVGIGSIREFLGQRHVASTSGQVTPSGWSFIVPEGGISLYLNTWSAKVAVGAPLSARDDKVPGYWYYKGFVATVLDSEDATYIIWPQGTTADDIKTFEPAVQDLIVTTRAGGNAIHIYPSTKTIELAEMPAGTYSVKTIIVSARVMQNNTAGRVIMETVPFDADFYASQDTVWDIPEDEQTLEADRYYISIHPGIVEYMPIDGWTNGQFSGNHYDESKCGHMICQDFNYLVGLDVVIGNKVKDYTYYHMQEIKVAQNEGSWQPYVGHNSVTDESSRTFAASALLRTTHSPYWYLVNIAKYAGCHLTCTEDSPNNIILCPDSEPIHSGSFEAIEYTDCAARAYITDAISMDMQEGEDWFSKQYAGCSDTPLGSGVVSISSDGDAEETFSTQSFGKTELKYNTTLISNDELQVGNVWGKLNSDANYEVKTASGCFPIFYDASGNVTSCADCLFVQGGDLLPWARITYAENVQGIIPRCNEAGSSIYVPGAPADGFHGVLEGCLHNGFYNISGGCFVTADAGGDHIALSEPSYYPGNHIPSPVSVAHDNFSAIGDLYASRRRVKFKAYGTITGCPAWVNGMYVLEAHVGANGVITGEALI